MIKSQNYYTNQKRFKIVCNKIIEFEIAKYTVSQKESLLYTYFVKCITHTIQSAAKV